MKKRTLKLYCISVVLALAGGLCSCAGGGGNATMPILMPNDITGEVTSDFKPLEVPNGDVDKIIQDFINQGNDLLLPSVDGTTQDNTEPAVPTEGDILLLGNSIESSHEGVSINGTTATISAAGEYTVSGTLNDGQIIVNTEKTEKVTLILNGVNITCNTSSPIYVMSCDSVTVTLAENTVNKLTDGTQYTYDVSGENEPNAALFSKDDLKINGNGALIVNANYNNGITSKNDLKIKSGTVTVIAKHDGIRGKDSVEISGGTVNVQSGGDAIKSNNELEAEHGFIIIDGGTFNISSGEDAIQAQTNLTISNGAFLIKTASGADKGITFSQASAKALKATNSIVVSGGSFSINSADDAIHSNGDVTISGGKIEVTSGDDGFHADNSLTISGGESNILKSYEGLESTNITIQGGITRVTASDDGINGAGGNDGSSSAGGRPGGWGGGGGNAKIVISGGYLYINAGGDGLDSNGTFTISGGTVLVDGPTNGGNGPLDYDGSFTISGGFLIAAGSSGMAQNASADSTQCCALIFTSGNANTIINLYDANRNSVVTYKPAKNYECVLISTPNLKQGESYTVSTGGSCTGDETDGLYTSGTYTGGIDVHTFTQSQTVISVGGSAHGGMMPPGGGGKPSGGRPPRF